MCRFADDPLVMPVDVAVSDDLSIYPLNIDFSWSYSRSKGRSGFVRH
jgi:hypothetical protein